MFKLIVRIVLILLTSFLSNHTYAQELTVIGSIKDSLATPLVNATIIANPTSEKFTTKFAISDAKGNFSLKLLHSSYSLKISYLGYQTKEITVTNFLKSDATIVLQKETNTLNTVTLNYKPTPIKVKRDTLTIDVKSFADGSEYKMQDLYDKIPGLVYEDGKLKVNGKEVNKVLVEGDEFFSGGTRLASENIPADAIKKLEFIDDYNNVSFLKSVSNTDKTVMNVKLKNPEKGFLFGDIDAKYGNDNFYDINPKLFKYSKEESIALLGSTNNLGNPLSSILSLKSIDDSNRFDDNSYGNDPLNKYRYSLKNVAEINNSAGAFGFKKNITSKTNLYTNFIWQSSNNEQRKQAINQFINPENTSIETSSNTLNNDVTSYSLNLELNTKISTTEELNFNFSAEKSNNEDRNAIESEINNETNFINNTKKNDVVSLSSDFNYYKKFNAKLITQINLNLENTADEEQDSFNSNQSLFEGIINFDDNVENFNFQQETNSNNSSINFNLKNYYSFNYSSTIILDAGINYIKEDINFNTSINETQNNFLTNIPNEVVTIKDVFVTPGLIYKKNSFIIESEVDIRDRKIINSNEVLLSPEVTLEYKKKFGNELQFSYGYKNQLPNTINYFSNTFFNSYQNISIGVADLKSNRFHELNFLGSYNNLSKGFTLNGFINFKKYTRSTILTAEIIEQNTLTKPINTSENREEVFARAIIGKVFNHIKINLTPFYSFSKEPQFNNDIFIENTSVSHSYKILVGTIFEKLPNVELSYRKGFKNYSSEIFERNFQTDNIGAYLSDYKGQLKYSISYNLNFTNDNFSNDFSNLGFTSSYDFKNSQWRISLEGENLLDDRSIGTPFITNTFVSDNQIERLPAIVLLGIIYKL